MAPNKGRRGGVNVKTYKYLYYNYYFRYYLGKNIHIKKAPKSGIRSLGYFIKN